MYNSSNVKCQLSFNWHLNLNKVCATQYYVNIAFILTLLFWACCCKECRVLIFNFIYDISNPPREAKVVICIIPEL